MNVRRVAIVIVNHLRTVATTLHEILPHYTEMPESAIESGCIDFILSPEDITREIVRISHPQELGSDHE